MKLLKKTVVFIITTIFIFTIVQFSVVGTEVNNLITTNADFEVYSNNQFNGWLNWASTGDNNSWAEKYVQLVSNGGRTGNCANLTSKTEGSFTLATEISNLKNEGNYEFSIWYKPQQNLVNGVPATWSYGTFKIYAEILDGSLAGGSFTSNIINISNTNVWSKLLLNFTMPADATKIRISLWNTGSWCPVFIDDAQLIEGGEGGEVSTVEPPPPEQNSNDLLKNSEFEDFNGTKFSSWAYWVDNSKFYSQTDGKTGKGAKITAGPDNQSYSLGQWIEGLTGGKNYKLKVWLKPTFNANSVGDIKLLAAIKNGASANSTTYSSPINSTTDWIESVLVFSVPNDATTVVVSIWGVGANFEVIADSATLEMTNEIPVIPDENTNLLSNPSFENFSNGNFTSWRYWVEDKYFYNFVADGKTGNAAKISAGDMSQSYSVGQVVSGLKPSTTYVFSGWVKTKMLANSSGGLKLLSYINNGAGKWIQFETDLITEDRDWVKLSVEISLPSDATEIFVGFWIQGSNVEATVDDASLVKGSLDAGDNNSNNNNNSNSSLVKNGAFSVPNGINSPSNWDVYLEDIIGSSSRWLSKSANQGYENSECVVLQNSGKAISYFYQTIDGLDVSKAYIFSALVRSEYVSSEIGGATIGIDYLDANDTILKSVRGVFLDGNQGWTEIRIKIDIVNNCSKLRLKLMLEKAIGNAYFDNVNVYMAKTVLDNFTTLGFEGYDSINTDTNVDIENYNENKEGENNPNTSDNSAHIVWLALLSFALFIFLRKRKMQFSRKF